MEAEENLGTVHLPLERYNEMRDLLDQLTKTTKTHEEFIQSFRASFKIITKMMSAQGIDMSQVYDYYRNLDFEVIEGVDVVKELDGDKTRVVIKKKQKGEKLKFEKYD